MDSLLNFAAAAEAPFTSLLSRGRGWTVPEFCAKTKKQTVEPFISYYEELTESLSEVRPDEDPDEDWGSWVPSNTWVRLSKLANRIGQLAYQEIDNPVYDEAACLAWKEENAQTWTKIEWGTSSANIGTPELPGSESSDVGG